MNKIKILLYVLCIALFLTSYSSAEEGTGIIVDVLSKTSLSWDSKPLPEYSEGKPEITILKIKIPPGAQLPLHKHPVINAGVLLSGELTVITSDNKILKLKAGEAFVEVVHTWHYGKNEGSTPAEIIVFYAGTSGMMITVHKNDFTEIESK
ncbi:MAG: cupin domain-containing protein [Nitrospiraceae bacterium]|nr:cupin domain-containing protein [Nitrospiraceae bacterium]